METLGLEVRRSFTVVAFAEWGHRPVVVGDGRRTVIPNAVRRGEWGSAAAEHADATWPDESSARGLQGPHAAAFWDGLRARLKHFLGVSDGTLSRVPVVVAFDGDPQEGKELQASLKAAHFAEVKLVPPPAAAAHVIPSVGTPDTVHRVICVGDVSAEVGTFRVRPAGVRGAGDVTSLDGVGAIYWIRALLQELDAVRSASREWNRLRLWQSMIELAAALDRSTADRPRVWTGAHADELVTDVTFRRDCLERVLEHLQLVEWLDRTSGEAAENSWAGGLGSVFPIRWPAGVQLLPDAVHAVAVGASLYGSRPVPASVRVVVSHAAPQPKPPALPHSPPVPPPAAPADPVPMFIPIPVPMPMHGPHGLPKLPDLPPDWERLIGGSE